MKLTLFHNLCRFPRRKLGIGDGEIFLLSFGGSLGAEYVNCAMLKLMKELGEQNPKLRCLHASGQRDHANCAADFKNLGLDRLPNCRLTDYIYDMPLQMAAADLVVSRAGAMTLSELARMGKAAILIPSPYVADNHQFYNAKAMADADAALLVEESELTNGKLTATVGSLLEDQQRITKMEQNVLGFADRDANREIWKQILEMTGK